MAFRSDNAYGIIDTISNYYPRHRAARDIRVSYDFERNGWKIEAPERSGWEEAAWPERITDEEIRESIGPFGG